MSNNRKKVLASSTALALGLTMFASAPAMADDVVTLTPSAGTTYNSILQAGFTLETEINPSNTADHTTLSYLITNSSEKDLDIEFTGAYGTGSEQETGYLDGDGDYAFDANEDFSDENENEFIVVTGYEVDDMDEVDTGTTIEEDEQNWGADADSGVNTLTVNTSVTDSDVTFKVQAWLDTNGDGLIGTFEPKSTERTVVLYKYSNVTGTLTLGELEIGNDSVSSSLTLNKDINLPMISGDLTVRYERNGSAIDLSEGGVDLEYGSLTYDDGALVHEETNTEDDIAAGVYRARAYVGTGTTMPISAYTGTQSVAAGSDTSVDEVYGYVLQTANIMATDADTPIQEDDNDDIYVRTGTKSVTVLAQALDGSGDKYAKAGLRVRAVIGEDTLDADTTITVGGKTLESGDSDITVEGSTNKDGIASFTITSSTGEAGDDIYVDLYVLDGSSWDGDYDTVDIDWEDAYVNSFYETSVQGDGDGSGSRSIKAEGSVSLNYMATDQFGQPLNSAMGRYQVEVDNDGGIDSDFTDTFVMTSGKASVTVRDNSGSTGNYTLFATLKEYDEDSESWETVSADEFEEADVDVAVVTDTTARIIDVDLSEDNDLSYSEYVTVDMRSNYDGAWPAAYSDEEYSSVYGYVMDELGQPIAGAPVTVSGSGMQFIDYDYDVYTVNSMTVHADNDGYFEVFMLSKTVGDNVVQISSGSATATVTVETDSAAYDAGSSVAFSAPTSAKAGRTLSVVATLTDAFGNPVAVDSDDAVTSDLSIVYDGPGFVMSEPTALNSRGQATVRVLLAAGETGIATVSFSYTNGDGDEVTGASATWVGPIANAIAAKKKDRVIIEAYRAKGKTVDVFVSGVKVASYKANKANFRKVVKGVKSGDRTVRVQLSGPGEDFRGKITIK
jgi:hypothetical protein